MNPVRIIKHQLYLLQLENHDLERFFGAVIRSIRPRLWPPRKELKFTPKLSLVAVLAMFFALIISISMASLFAGNVLQILIFLVVAYLSSVVFFVYLIAAEIIVWPVDWAVKLWIIAKAERKISKLRNLKVIGIAGSYGKTTMKETLATVLGQSFRVIKTPESVNTPVGIAKIILGAVNEETQIFIVEMGAYRQGEIRAMCKIVQPDISVLTGINEAHLERFGSLENTIAAKFEIIKFAKARGVALMNGDSRLIQENYLKFMGDRKEKFYRAREIGKWSFLPDLPGLEFEIDGKSHRIPVLGEYILGIIAGAVTLAKLLGVMAGLIHSGLDRILPVSHRLQPMKSGGGIMVIDDSYSGNPEGVREAVNVLAKFEGRRKVYITPGLVEMGEKSREIHIEIGKQLAAVADLVILIKNSVTSYIDEGIVCASSERTKVIWFESATAAHAALPRILKSGDVVLFQNDWPENYQ